MLTHSFTLVPATVTFLEMHTRPSGWAPRHGTDFELLKKPLTADTYRQYYYGVGEKHNWLDRMVMPDEELLAKINAGNTDIYLMRINGLQAGFAEFVVEEHFTEILYFGLFPNFVGKGFGHYFLQWVIEKAWSYPNTKWIQLNTCTLDHNNALPVYLKAGFVTVRTEEQQRKKLI